MTDPKKGDHVSWSWGTDTAKGVVQEVFTDHVSRSIKGLRVTRNASPEEPACLIEQDDGDAVLKSASELSRTKG